MKTGALNKGYIHLKWHNVALILFCMVYFVACIKQEKQVMIGQITGSSAVVYGEQGVVYSIEKPKGVDYVLWSVPEQAQIESGQGTDKIVLNFGRLAGNVCANFYSNGQAVSPQPSCLEVSFGAPHSWARLVNFPRGKRGFAVGFSIGTKGYIGTGVDGLGNIRNDWWEFDSENLTWTQKANLGNALRTDTATYKRYEAFGFSANGKGYVCGGFPGGGASYSDTWEYNPDSDTWSVKSSFPGGPRQAAFTFSMGDKGYVGGGYTGYPPYFNDFYEYNTQNDQWIQKQSFPLPKIAYAVAFSINNKGYVGTGSTGAARIQDFYEYNPQTDLWTQKNSFTGLGRSQAVGFSIGNKGYIGLGVDSNSNVFNDMWEYNPETDTWLEKAHAPRQLYCSVGFAIGDRAYIGTGYYQSNPNVNTNEFYLFVP